MASSSPLEDLTENFFLCSVCLDQFKEPKLLPCLHRYCRDCLDKIIQASIEGTFKCPTCKKTCDISKDSTDGFKTDFHMKSMLEFIQLQKSFQNKDLKECGSCSKKLKMSVYCFKCREFLCDQCGQYHKNNRLFRDHKQHILKLENYENQDLLLAILTGNPRCHHHVEQEAQLCCSTCGNLPVCVTCVYGKHKGHDIHDVVEVAERERGSLKTKLLDINKHKDKLHDLPNMVDKSMKKLRENFKNESRKINLQYEEQAEKITDIMTQMRAKRKKSKENIKARRKREINEIKRKHEKEMRQVEEKYDEESKETDKTHDRIIKHLERKLKKLAFYVKEVTAEGEENRKVNETKLQNILEYCEQIITRYDNFTETTSSILASNDKWANVQSIPDIRAASELLIEEMKKEFPELESLPNFKLNDLSNFLPDVISIIERNESVIDVEDFQRNGLKIDNVTNISDGNYNMVLIGMVSQGYSYIAVIDRDGKVQRKDEIKHVDFICPRLSCCRLSEFKVATVCYETEVGIYDVRDGSSYEKSMEDIFERWPSFRFVASIAVDHVNNQIMLGTNSDDVYVLDDRLNYSHILTLPNIIKMSRDITLHHSNLIVCDFNGKSAYLVTMEESECELIQKFTKPDDSNDDDWRPLSVCTDKNMFIYILWRNENSCESSCILVQYNRDGRKLLSQLPVDEDARCITVLGAEGSENESLLLATYEKGKIYFYPLIDNTEVN